ncbi:MAG: tetratricopeptide repeat protein, partial [Actinomycetota bacterium]|nr:tetratricopeptide repeat protein [Actinomycetota bacterium]
CGVNGLYSGWCVGMLLRGDPSSMSRAVFRVSAGVLVGVLVLLATALALSRYYLVEELRLVAAGDLRGALEATRTAARLDPFDPDPLESESFILRQQGKYEAAAGSLREAIERDPNNYSPYLLLGDLQATGLKDLKAAAESYREALRLDPNATLAQSALAQILTKQGKLEEAREEYESLEEKVSLSFQGLYDLGRIEVRTGDPRDGLRHIKRARREARAALEGLNGPLRERQEALVASVDLAVVDALVVLGRYDQARKILAKSPSEQAPGLLELLDSDPGAYREQVVNSDVY